MRERTNEWVYQSTAFRVRSVCSLVGVSLAAIHRDLAAHTKSMRYTPMCSLRLSLRCHYSSITGSIPNTNAPSFSFLLQCMKTNIWLKISKAVNLNLPVTVRTLGHELKTCPWSMNLDNLLFACRELQSQRSQIYSQLTFSLLLSFLLVLSGFQFQYSNP